MNDIGIALSADLRDELDINADPPELDIQSVPVRFSHLKAIGRSPAHCRHAMSFDEPSLAKRMGSATHSMLLGGQPVVVFPGKVRNGKAWEAFKVDHAGSIIVSAKEYARARNISNAVRSNSVASRVLFGDGYVYEETIHWELDGRAMRCTPDVRSWRHLVDLKTCRTAEPEKFMWDSVRMGYHAQLAIYAQAMATQHKSGSEPQDVYIVAVESAPPHVVVVRRMTPQTMDVGRRLVRGWFDTFRECERRNVWPGYADAVVDMDVPLEAVDLIWPEDEADGVEQ